MKNLVPAISCSLLLASSAAIAADLPTKSPSPLSVAPAYNWTGFYAGVNAGYGTGPVEEELSAVDITLTGSDKFTGWFAGGQVGFNSQIGNFVWGLEGDFQKSWQKGTATIPGGINGDISAELEMPWFATARLRAGFASGASLFYLTGGGVWTEGKTFFTDGVDSVSSATRRNGWTIGAGYEAMMSPRWTWKVEYLYAKIRDKETDLSVGLSNVERVNDHIIRIGANYRFGG
jgi:outer membrane immunogenic protein